MFNINDYPEGNFGHFKLNQVTKLIMFQAIKSLKNKSSVGWDQM